ncbi:SHOCT domain-containing protein [Nocardia pseudobrasiliensis]|uniref:Putative membrane protein n=1 Tax=Nocardia pseudobrasiliensis TaxID=45979 RepID=A0A370IC28_9NOCA|nr:SHOCT domain-containing protein [Nocardia pseudobrasiliensis]RDI68288.1 putative membrane protein [Nocardia pseudobrasiliensis]
MMWYGTGMSGWAYGMMAVGMIVFWALVIGGIVVLVRYVSRAAGMSVSGPARPSPQQVLAGRYARGEIDDDEYVRRMKVLDSDPLP